LFYHESDCPWWRSVHNSTRQKQVHNNQVTQVTHSTINHSIEVRVEKLLDHEPANQLTRRCFDTLSRPSLPRQVYSTEDHLIKKDAYAVRFPGKGEGGGYCAKTSVAQVAPLSFHFSLLRKLGRAIRTHNADFKAHQVVLLYSCFSSFDKQQDDLGATGTTQMHQNATLLSETSNACLLSLKSFANLNICVV